MIKLFIISVAFFGAANLSDVSYYEVLGVTKQASSQEIRQAYKKLAVKLHPDKNPNETEREKFLKITEAYETLKDQEKRHQYDLYGSQTTYSRKYDYKSQSEYDNLYYNGLYHNDPYVETLSGGTFYNYLQEGFHFINFYSPFCPPCQSVAEDWKKLAEIYKGIVKVGAVNCKYHNSFCYNSMRIGSYPSLLFYPNGKNGNFVYYQGDRTLEALDKFVMAYLKSRVHVPTITQMRSTDKPMAYVLGDNRIDRGVLTRIAYQLNGLVTLAIVEDDNIRSKLTDDDYTTIVFKYNKINKEIQTTEEKDILQEIIESLPKVTAIDPVKLRDIRMNLRSGSDIPWVLYFARKGDSKLQLHQMKLEFPNMEFGEVNCEDWSSLCASLQVDGTPAWGLLKRAGAYQRAPPTPTTTTTPHHAQHFIRTAARAVRLYSLSVSELTRILDGDAGAWLLLIVPYKISWEHIVEPFTRTSLHYLDSEDLSFGIMTCTANSDICRQVAHNQPMIYLQNGTRRHTYNRRIGEQQLIEFIDLIRDSSVIELNERLVLDIVDPSSRDHTWLVAFLPPHCNHCEEIALQWNIVANKLRPLEFVRVGVLKCEHDSGGFCNNVRSPVAKLYPIASGKHYSVSLQHLSEAPYMLEWALGYIDDSIQKLNWNSFTKTVIAEELNPTGGKKPWLVYFHSPRCYRCYEMYADFAIAGFLLNNAVQLGKVNCISDRGLCQHEQITSYPSLKLYLSRNKQQQFSSVISIPVKEYSSLLQDIKPYLMKYDENILAGIDNFGSRKPFDIQHDEF